MLALVAAVEMLVASRPLDYSDPVSLSWRLTAQYARDESPGCRVLCVGDSLVKHAVIPAVVEAPGRLRAVNLGVAGGPAPATFFLLHRPGERPRPDAVVVNFKPSVLIGSPRYNLRYWQEIVTPRECLELSARLRERIAPDGDPRRPSAPSFRCRHEIRGLDPGRAREVKLTPSGSSTGSVSKLVR